MGKLQDFCLDVCDQEVIKQKEREFVRFALNDPSIDENDPRWKALSNEFYNDLDRHNLLQAYDLVGQDELLQFPLFLFDESLDDIHKIIEILSKTTTDKHEELYHKMLYSHLVTVLEVYLSDLAKGLIIIDSKLMDNAISNINELRNKKFTLCEINNDPTLVIATVNETLSTFLYHNIPKTIRVFEGIIGTGLDIDIGEINEVCNIRHHLIHRNGSTKSGESIEVDKEMVIDAANIVIQFMHAIQKHITEYLLQQSGFKANC